MLRNRSILFIFFISVFLFIVFCVPSKTKSQAWSGLLAPTRAMNWSGAGAGTIPARTTICQTLGTAGQSPTYSQNVTAAQIVAALQACAGKSQTVYLNPGTYTMTQTIFGPNSGGATPSNVTLRGAGPQQTILTWTATSNNCDGIGATAFCIFNGDSGAIPYVANAINWTGGYSQGTTTLTLGSAVTGSLSNLQVGTLLDLNQLDPSSDTGNWWPCGSSGSNGTCSQQGVANAWSGRSQNQIVTVTAISGSTITISPGLYAPNWSSSQTPYATFSSTLPVTGFGLESLQVNTQQLGDIQAMVETLWASNSWVKNVALVNNVGSGGIAARKHVEVASSAHFTVRDSYMYGSSPSSEGYGIDFMWGTADSLAENNICQHLASCLINETSEGNVFGYNFAVDNFYTGNGTAPNWQQCDVFHHDASDYFNLWEGHDGICASFDDIHGTAFGLTLFRNYLNGRDQATQCPGGGTGCGTASKTQNTEAVQDLAYARYSNIVANVLGTTGYHNTYQVTPTSTTDCSSNPATTIYSLGYSSQDQVSFSAACLGASFTVYNDPLVQSSMVRWGNYDVVNGSVQTNSSETASGASTYPGLSSPSTSWGSYLSLYLSGKPSWWGSMPWPAVGPDVTGGNIANVGGHAFHNPAANCFLNVLGGQANGSSGPVPFDATNCYSNTASSTGPPAPLNLTGTIVQ